MVGCGWGWQGGYGSNRYYVTSQANYETSEQSFIFLLTMKVGTMCRCLWWGVGGGAEGGMGLTNTM